MKTDREFQGMAAKAAGLQAAGGHLSALVDDLRGLLAESMQVMKALHESASPDDGPEINAIIPAADFRRFVDANAALMHKIAVGPHGGMLPKSPTASKPEDTIHA